METFHISPDLFNWWFLFEIINTIFLINITSISKTDEFGNPIKTVISNKIVSEPTNGVSYLRLKGTNKYLKINPVNKKLILKYLA